MPDRAGGSLRGRLERSLARLWESRGAASLALTPFAFLFAAVLQLRGAIYGRGWLATSRLPARVIVVGNLVVGGAGKTPAVLAIVATLRGHGWTPGIVSRGYGRARGKVVEVDPGCPEPRRTGDEPLLLARRAAVPVVVGRDRLAAGHLLLQAHPNTDVIVCDDGLQHTALERDIEVLVFDERGAGNGRLIPAGPLRQSLSSWNETAGADRNGRKPQRLVLYNAATPTTSLAGFIGRRTLLGIAPLEAWWRGMAPSAEALAGLRGRKVVAAAGIARPGRFFVMLREHGLLVDELPLPDHHDFAILPWPAQAGDVVVTEKDAVKIPIGRRIGARIWVATLDFRPAPQFDAALLAMLSSLDPAPQPSYGNTTA